MRWRLSSALALTIAFAVVGAPAAGARPARPYRKLPLLGTRTCGALLNRASFKNAVSEKQTVAGLVGPGFASNCTFLPPEQEGTPPHRGIGGGNLTLEVYKRASYEFRGKERNLASFVPSPQGYFRSRRNAGEHAYGGFLLNTEGGPDAVFGVVQVRNDVATIAGEFPASSAGSQDQADLSWLDERLRTVALELCPRCR